MNAHLNFELGTRNSELRTPRIAATPFGVRSSKFRVRSSITLLSCWLLLFTAHAEDWRAQITARPGKFPTLRALTGAYEFGWSGVKAGEAELTFSHAKGGLLTLDITGRTTGLARGMWRMDSKATSSCNAATLRPVRLDEKETYKKKTMTTVVDFKANGVTALVTPNPPDKHPPKPKTFKFSNAHDLHSALLFLRSQPLRDGDAVRLCVYPGGSPYLAEITVLDRCTTEAAGKKWAAIRCSVKLQEIAKDFTLVPHKKFKSATAWLSDDADRLLLRVESEVFIGSVWMEMKGAEFAK